MAYYIIDRKLNNLSKTSSFTIIFTVSICGSLLVCALFASEFFMPRLLRLHLLCFSEMSALYVSFVVYFVCLDYLCLVSYICICYALVSHLLICVFYGLLCLHLRSRPDALYLRLLCLDKLSAQLHLP